MEYFKNDTKVQGCTYFSTMTNNRVIYTFVKQINVLSEAFEITACKGGSEGPWSLSNGYIISMNIEILCPFLDF